MAYIFHQVTARTRLLFEPDSESIKSGLSEYNKVRGLNDHGYPTSLLRDGITFPNIPMFSAVIADRPATKPMKVIPDIIIAGVYWAVSAKIKDIIHELDSNIHQFEKIDVFTSKSRSDSKKYYAWILGAAKSGVVDFDRRDTRVMTDSNGKHIQKPVFPTQSERIFLHESAMANGHAWHALEISRSIVVSDELRDRLVVAKMTGVEFLKLGEA